MRGLATVTLGDLWPALLVAAVALVGGFLLARFRTSVRSDWVGKVERRGVHVALVALLVVFIVLALATSAEDQAAEVWRSHAIGLASLVALLLLLAAIGREEPIATQPFTYTLPEDTEEIQPGERVSKKIAEAHPKLVKVEYVAKEPFTYDDDGKQEVVQKDALLSEAVAKRDDVKGHVITRRTARKRILHRSPRVIPKDSIVPKEALEAPEAKYELRLRSRLQGLLVGKDGRWSTSKTQAFLWTFGILYALIALFVFAEVFDEPLEVRDAEGDGFGDILLPDEYYLLLGGPFAAAIVSKAIVASKVQNGTIVKPDAATTTRNPIEAIAEVVSDDTGNQDLVDTQYFLFNLLALVVFAVAFLGGLSQGMPDIPEPLFGLTSAAALAYVSKKAVDQSTPEVTSASPTTVRPGGKVDIWGQYLVTGEQLPHVTVGGQAVIEPIELVEETGSAADGDHLRIVVPELAAGQAALVVTPRGGKPTTAFNLTIEGIAITAVSPEPVPVTDGQRIVLTGTGFGATTGSVSLGGETLTVDAAAWSPSTIVAELQAGVKYPTGDAVTLQVQAEGQLGVRQTKVEALVVTDVTPRPIPMKPGTELQIAGRGFGRGSITAKLGNNDLAAVVSSDTRIVAKLKTGVGYPLGDAVELLVSDSRGYKASLEAAVVKPS